MVKIIIILISVLITVANVTLLERKWLAIFQKRTGPTIVGYQGILQPFSDAIKLITKENIIPTHANKLIFIIAPLLSLFFSLINYVSVPFTENYIIDINYNILFNIVLSSLGVYGILLSGWAANSSYSFLGSLRSSAQIISYELVFITHVIIVIILASFNYSEIISLQIYYPLVIMLFPIFIIYFISILAETNRAPLDLPEAESELVAGFFTEHSSVPFVIFFLAEYSSLFFLSYFTSILWFGQYIIIITIVIVVIFILVRATLPRLRFDMLIIVCWKLILPVSIAIFVFVFSLHYLF